MIFAISLSPLSFLTLVPSKLVLPSLYPPLRLDVGDITSISWKPLSHCTGVVWGQIMCGSSQKAEEMLVGNPCTALRGCADSRVKIYSDKDARYVAPGSWPSSPSLWPGRTRNACLTEDVSAAEKWLDLLSLFCWSGDSFLYCRLHFTVLLIFFLFPHYHRNIKEVLIGSLEICVRSEKEIYRKRADGLRENFPRRLQLFKNGRN